MPLIAGHTFDDSHDPVCTCARSWSSIATITESDIGKHEIAHTAYLTAKEYAEIAAERTRREERAARIWAAVEGVAG